MNDPMRWAIPLYRAFGIQVRLHLLFLLITVPLCLRAIGEVKGEFWFEIVMLTIGILFASVLLHEYGHSFAARWVGGESSEILLWPLGGLAFVEVPHTPKNWAIVTICGPLVNVAIILVCSLAILAGGYSPLKALNPWNNPIVTPTHNYRDGREYLSPSLMPKATATTAEQAAALEAVKTGWPFMPAWVSWAWRIIAVNWWLFLFNMLIPAFPMDCGRLVHSYLWARTNYQRATVTCCYIGYAAAVVMLGITIFSNEFLLGGLALWIALNCYMTLRQEADTERGAFGYDFSQGYTSLERDDPPPPKPKQPGPIKRWMAARKAKKLQEEREAVARDDERMDQLLDKIAKQGKNSLTDEERKFMERVSARYRNK